ncbi:putative restriction endonuclease [Nocardiopsis sp. Huas11]|uniref:Uma2 family endonuclease n=1 Tax=Nocardiopsis sp. Huas11 TaxID=2183912 RepID=UPI000EB11C55|nr:Uma2 family endonuclease [Nocardiopsis sp. Huas11]RKS08770.1 putative restriction endonuclease [Nocardiopsis sp. Huas11]
MCAQPVPDWLIPPPEGFRAEDLDALPDLPPHTELIDGSLIIVSPQKVFHSALIDVIMAGMYSCTPRELRVRREISVTLAPRQRPEPDLMVVGAGASTGGNQTSYTPETVLLVAEVVSPESAERDRYRKPELYAQAGIPHFWRIEDNDGSPVVYVYELDPAKKCYVPTGIHHDRLKIEQPYPIDIDLTEVERRI